MKQLFLDNIDLSSQVIVFDQQTHQGSLEINNKHESLGVLFKIKTTKLNVIDVKPAKGFIKPLGKVTINFKLLQKVTAKQMQSLERNDKFQLQFLNIVNKQATRQQIQDIWKAYKQKTANLQHGYGCYKVFMNLTGKRISYNSNSKSQMSNSKSSQVFKSIVGNKQHSTPIRNSNTSERESINDDQLAKKYQELKQKQVQLNVKRRNVFESKSTITKSSSGGLKFKYLVILIILFLLAFLTGNYVRSSMIKVKPVEKVKKQQSFFNSLFKLFK